jgi:hypothetical protein
MNPSIVIVLLLLLCPAAAHAAPLATVDAVQMPAWRLRGGHSAPLQPGMILQRGDQVKTGAGARVYVRLAEGSTLKLGETANLDVQSLAVEEGGLFKGALEVAAGAFRFTTGLVARLKKREVAIKVGTATLGIRGTDVWGRAGPDQDLVMLIEGQVEVKAERGEIFNLRESLTTYLAPRGKAPQSLIKATQQELETRAQETDIARGGGALRSGGKWSLRLGAALGEQEARTLRDQARQAGFAARMRSVDRTKRSYEIVIPGFASEAEARAAAGGVGGQLGVDARAVR